MAKKEPSHLRPDAPDVKGWILVCKDESGDGWYIGWLDVFGSRKAARAFAKDNNWPGVYRAVHGRLLVDHQ
jgi:hypothetical protein